MIVNATDFTARQVLGAAMLDLPRILPHLLTEGGWMNAVNRHDHTETSAVFPGLRVNDSWSSGLHACKVLPWLGTLLMQRAFAQWPVRFAKHGVHHPQPQLSFILPFRGLNRLPQLIATIESIFGQQEVSVECIVVEQSNVAEAEEFLPQGVRYLHLPHPHGDPGWRKSWAYNVGAEQARAPMLVCHDGDILVPAGYAKAILQTVERGAESLHIQRFLFYFGQQDSAKLLESRKFSSCRPEEVRQNWEGGTLAIQRKSYFDIGGFDERFVDWGGEDNEFFDRCKSLRQCRFGFVPFAHVWHPPQATKSGPGRDAAVAMMNERLAIPAHLRIEELVKARNERAVNRGCT